MIRKKLSSAYLLIVAFLLFSVSANAIQWDNKKVDTIMSYDNECLYFRLQGVDTADPTVVPNTPYFALQKVGAGYAESLSFLITAQVTGRTIRVNTSGLTVCGKPQVVLIEINAQ